MKRIILTSFFLTFCVLGYGQDAVYSITFESNWSQAAHPHSSGSLPAGAHWSRLVGATHNNTVSFLQMGETASPGVEDIAELGSNTVFFNEVNAAITAGTADQTINGPALATAGGSIEISSLTVSEDYSLLTLASMIAPSPDWMIAISGIDLLESPGNWKDEIVIDLYPYDAGTDSGTDYSSPNMNTSPAADISSLQGVTPFSSAKIGTLTITFDGLLNIEENSARQFTISPNPAQDVVNIEAKNNSLSSITIFNTLGKQIKQFSNVKAASLQVDLSDLVSGLYLVQVIDTNGNSSIKKMIKR
ncbi:MAG: spondin domain-containing protein [Gilvibacter sp.]